MSVVLQEPIKEGYGVVIPDNIYVGGNTYRQMIKNWELLRKHCFPQRIELLGWIEEDNLLKPDPHRINTLVTAELTR